MLLSLVAPLQVLQQLVQVLLLAVDAEPAALVLKQRARLLELSRGARPRAETGRHTQHLLLALVA